MRKQDDNEKSGLGKKRNTSSASYTNTETYYTNGTGANCNVTSQAIEVTGARADCKEKLSVYDMAGNVREWVDKRILPYDISAMGESRFGNGPTISSVIPNGIDNIVQRFHATNTAAAGRALTAGASYLAPMVDGRKQYGPEMQVWSAQNSSAVNIGFRCVGFRNDDKPTMTKLALPDEPKFTATDYAGEPSTWTIPENFYVKDNKWESVSITIDGNTADSVAEGKIELKWSPWSKTVCNSAGSCSASGDGLIYKVYRFLEPNRVSNRFGFPWALNWSGLPPVYTNLRQINPLAVSTSMTRQYTASSTYGKIIATRSDCLISTPANCQFTDSSTAGTGFLPGKMYNYMITVTDADGNEVLPMVQKFRTPFLAGDPLSTSEPAWRVEPRLRRASVMLVDEAYQQAQTSPQIMVHVPMDKSGLDHDYYIHKYEASTATGTFANNGSEAVLRTQTPTSGWLSKAGECNELIAQNKTFAAACGDTNGIVNATQAQVQSKKAILPATFVDQGSAWKACRNSAVADDEGFFYHLKLTTDSEWSKAADWGDVNQDGTIDQSVYVANVGLASSSLEYGTPNNTTVRCHTDNNPTTLYLTNSTATAHCRSRYGAADMIGNAYEITSGQISSGAGSDNGEDGLWLNATTPASDGSFAATKWDLVRSIPTATGATLAFNSDAVLITNSGIQTSIRGGGMNSLGASGRYYHNFQSSPASVAGTDTGFRCSL